MFQQYFIHGVRFDGRFLLSHVGSHVNDMKRDCVHVTTPRRTSLFYCTSRTSLTWTAVRRGADPGFGLGRPTPMASLWCVCVCVCVCVCLGVWVCVGASTSKCKLPTNFASAMQNLVGQRIFSHPSGITSEMSMSWWICCLSLCHRADFSLCPEPVSDHTEICHISQSSVSTTN